MSRGAKSAPLATPWPKRRRTTQDFASAGGLMPLVDILFATLGVFVIVLATQEIFEDIPKVEVAADAAILCNGPEDLHVVLAGERNTLAVAFESLSATLSDLMPTGGAIIVGITDNCLIGTPSAFSRLISLDDALAVISEENAFFRMRFVPVGVGAYSTDALVAAMSGGGVWPSVVAGEQP